MDFIVSLLNGTGIATALLYICLTAFVGVLVGKLEVQKVKLGIAGVLFTGIILAHFGARVNPEMLHFAKEFGLILFVYGIGIDVGPRFFSMFRSDGLLLNILAMSIIFIGFGIAMAFHYFGGVAPEVITGIMCGAVTNTPGLGAAQQAIAEANRIGANIDPAIPGMGYAVAYPIGVLGIIITMIIVRAVFRVKIEKEAEDYNNSIGVNANHLESVVITITNPNLFGKTIGYIKDVIDKELVISRIERKGEFLIPTETLVLEEGDIAHGVSDDKKMENIRIKMGAVEIGQKREITGAMAMFRVLITNRKIAGKTIDQIGIYRRYEANITRIYRSGMEILPTKNTTVELGDTVRIVGKRELLPDIQKELGNSIKELSHPNIVPIFMGITIGVILGSIPLYLPGLPAPAKLGLAGGPLIIAILMGWKGRIKNFSFYMSPGANMIIRELGIILFLACVGLGAGGEFVNTLVNRGGYMWVLYGAAITIIPLIIVSIIARLKGINYLKICGFMAGSMTDPPALEYANSLSPIHAQSMAYATVYPLTMFLRILLGQTLILITL